jgi:hypothetical protein
MMEQAHVEAQNRRFLTAVLGSRTDKNTARFTDE